jgi:hypothetical protein
MSAIPKTWLGKDQGKRLVAILAQIDPSLNPRDRVLWVLSEGGGKMTKSTLRRRVALKSGLLNPILEELAKEGRIRIEEQKVILL